MIQGMLKTVSLCTYLGHCNRVRLLLTSPITCTENGKGATRPQKNTCHY